MLQKPYFTASSNFEYFLWCVPTDQVPSKANPEMPITTALMRICGSIPLCIAHRPLTQRLIEVVFVPTCSLCCIGSIRKTYRSLNLRYFSSIKSFSHIIAKHCPQSGCTKLSVFNMGTTSTELTRSKSKGHVVEETPTRVMPARKAKSRS